MGQTCMELEFPVEGSGVVFCTGTNCCALPRYLGIAVFRKHVGPVVVGVSTVPSL